MQHLPNDIPLVVGKGEPYHSVGPGFGSYDKSEAQRSLERMVDFV